MARNYLVVGGTSGIGSAVVGLLTAAGHRVVEMSRHPKRSVGHPCLTSRRWDAAEEAFPGDGLPEALDGLVYCPGTIRLKPFPRLRLDEFREDVEISLLGAVRASARVVGARVRTITRRRVEMSR